MENSVSYGLQRRTIYCCWTDGKWQVKDFWYPFECSTCEWNDSFWFSRAYVRLLDTLEYLLWYKCNVRRYSTVFYGRRCLTVIPFHPSRGLSRCQISDEKIEVLFIWADIFYRVKNYKRKVVHFKVCHNLAID